MKKPWDINSYKYNWSKENLKKIRSKGPYSVLEVEYIFLKESELLGTKKLLQKCVLFLQCDFNGYWRYIKINMQLHIHETVWNVSVSLVDPSEEIWWIC